MEPFNKALEIVARATSGVPVFSMTFDIPTLRSSRPAPKALDKIIENRSRAAGRALLLTRHVCQHLRIVVCRFPDDHVVVRCLVYRLLAVATQNNFGHGRSSYSKLAERARENHDGHFTARLIAQFHESNSTAAFGIHY